MRKNKRKPTWTGKTNLFSGVPIVLIVVLIYRKDAQLHLLSILVIKDEIRKKLL